MEIVFSLLYRYCSGTVEIMEKVAAQEIKQLLGSAQGRNAVRGLVKMVKAAPTVDKVLGRTGAETDVIHEIADIHRLDSEDFTVNRDGGEPSYFMIAGTSVGALGGLGFGTYDVTHPLTIATPPTDSGPIVSESTQTSNGVTTHSETITQTSTGGTPGVSPQFAHAFQIAGVLSLVAGGISAILAAKEIVTAVKFAHGTRVLDNFNQMALQTRESLSEAGYERAAEDHGLDQLLTHVNENLGATQSALRSAERGTLNLT